MSNPHELAEQLKERYGATALINQVAVTDEAHLKQIHTLLYALLQGERPHA
jgi:hypothetical protein